MPLLHKYKDLRNSVPAFSGREFLIFVFFLAVSALFWFLSTLNDTYEQDYAVRIELTEVPEDVVITEPLPDTVHVVIRDKGYSLLAYTVSDVLRPVRLRYPLYAYTDGHGVVPPNEVQKMLKGRLGDQAVIAAVKAAHWDFYYNHGARKRVPVVFSGGLTPAKNYYISSTVATPDSVTIYATEAALDTINAVHTARLRIDNISQSATIETDLQPIAHAKIVPPRCTLSYFVDQLTEVVVPVPVNTIGTPEGVMMKTFPAIASVRVAVGMKRAAGVKPEQFSVVADYADIASTPGEKLHLKILVQPRGIVRATLTNPTVDYVIEQ